MQSKKPKSRDKSRVINQNQIDLPGFSVFELFDQLAEYYGHLLSSKNAKNGDVASYPFKPEDYKRR